MVTNAIKELYSWEIELKNGKIVTSGNKFDNDMVVRVSFIPKIKLLPRHDVIFTDFMFEKLFMRTFMTNQNRVFECLHCLVTNRFRMYLKSTNGQCIITSKTYDLYI